MHDRSSVIDSDSGPIGPQVVGILKRRGFIDAFVYHSVYAMEVRRVALRWPGTSLCVWFDRDTTVRGFECRITMAGVGVLLRGPHGYICMERTLILLTNMMQDIESGNITRKHAVRMAAGFAFWEYATSRHRWNHAVPSWERKAVLAQVFNEHLAERARCQRDADDLLDLLDASDIL